MEKRYQVFVSSTFSDLQEERQEVIQALLELDCIPAGMELFPAADEDQWSLIKKVIDDCDYYVVIVAGRYGSLGPEGIGYTEMEYRYALDTKKPVIGFVHSDPGKLASERCESTEIGKKKLGEFRALVQQKPCKFWQSRKELGSVVSRSLVKLIKTNPAIGWVRADLVPAAGSAEEILRLKTTIDDLNRKLVAARTEIPSGTEVLAQGDDKVTLAYTFEVGGTAPSWGDKTSQASLVATWSAIFAFVSPRLIDELPEQGLRSVVSGFIASVAVRKKEFRGSTLYNFRILDDDFQTIKVQFRALGLITKSDKPRSVKDTGTYWTLTPYGDTMMTRLRAIAKPPHTAAADAVADG